MDGVPLNGAKRAGLLGVDSRRQTLRKPLSVDGAPLNGASAPACARRVRRPAA